MVIYDNADGIQETLGMIDFLSLRGSCFDSSPERHLIEFFLYRTVKI